VVVVIAVGYWMARAAIIRAEAVKDLSNLAFLVLTPALLFRTMSTVHIEQLDFVPVASYFLGVTALFAGILLVKGLGKRAIVMTLACTFSNTVMIGIPLVGLAYGQAGMVVLLTLVSIHALVLLTAGTVLLELVTARENANTSAGRKPLWQTMLLAAKSALIHPVPLPILLGLAFAQTGLAIPQVLDKPMQWLGSAFGPLALLLVGMTLAGRTAKEHWSAAIGMALTKNVLLPVFVAIASYLMHVDGLHLTVMVVTASLPIGANVFLFSQRYKTAEAEVTAAVALSTLFALATLSVVMYLYPV
jgi:predicted permease